MSGDALVGTVEVIEPSPYFAAESRQSSMASFCLLGPPDLVTVKKEYAPTYGKTTEQTYYHFVRGFNVSSETRISTYIADIVNSHFRQGSWFPSGGGKWRVIGLNYRTYCAMHKVDIIVSAEIPGGVSVTALDPEGLEKCVTDEMWLDCFVSAACRHMQGVGEAPVYPCMKVFPGFSRPEEEEEVLLASLALQDRWHLTGTDRAYKDLMDRSCNGCADSRIATALYRYFASHSRFEQAVSFFGDRAGKADPECRVYAARAYLAMGRDQDAKDLLDEVFRELPQSRLCAATMLETLCALGDFEGAERFFEDNRACTEADSLAVVQLALAHAKSGRFDVAFTCLNLAEMPPPTLDPFLRELIPARRSKKTHDPSKEKLGDVDVVRVVAARMKEERLSGLDKRLNELPARIMTEPDRAAYKVLVTLLDAIGWEELLATRGRCFLMKEDVQHRLRQIEEDVAASEARIAAGNGDGADPDHVEEEITVKEGDRIRDIEQEMDKKLCQPWLDYLVMTMWEDLKCKREMVAELREGEEDVPVEVIAAETPLLAVDWLRRADLARRLRLPKHASRALEVSIRVADKSRQASVSANLEVLNMSVEEGDLHKSIQTAAEVMEVIQQLVPKARTIHTLPALRKAIYALCTKTGLRAVRDSLGTVDQAAASRVQEILLDAVNWHVYRFDE